MQPIILQDYGKQATKGFLDIHRTPGAVPLLIVMVTISAHCFSEMRGLRSLKRSRTLSVYHSRHLVQSTLSCHTDGHPYASDPVGFTYLCSENHRSFRLDTGNCTVTFFMR